MKYQYNGYIENEGDKNCGNNSALLLSGMFQDNGFGLQL